METRIRQLEEELKEIKDQLRDSWKANKSLAIALEKANSTIIELFNELKDRKNELSELRMRNQVEETKTLYADSETSSIPESKSSEDQGKFENGEEKERKNHADLEKPEYSEDQQNLQNDDEVTGELECNNTNTVKSNEDISNILQTVKQVANEQAKNREMMGKCSNMELQEKMSNLQAEFVKTHAEIHNNLKYILEVVMKPDAKITRKEEEERKREEKEEKEQLLSSLVGPFEWMKSKISVVNGEIRTVGGKTFSLEEWKNAIQIKTPWTLLPEEYEVECWASFCGKQIPVSSNLREDKACVKCPICKYETPLGSPKPGFEWVGFSPCCHFHQVPIGERPKNCLFCGKGGSCYGNWNSGARVPQRK